MVFEDIFVIESRFRPSSFWRRSWRPQFAFHILELQGVWFTTSDWLRGRCNIADFANGTPFKSVIIIIVIIINYVKGL